MNKSTIFLAAMMLCVGLGAGYFYASFSTQHEIISDKKEKQPLFYRNPMDPTITSPIPAKDSMGMDYIPVYEEDNEQKEAVVLYYRNPMNPEITSPTPAKDSMGMDYIPVYAEERAQSDVIGTVSIDPVVVQNIGVRTVVVKKQTFTRDIKTVGRVDFNEESMVRLHPKIDGWVEEIMVDRTGEYIDEDAMLLSIYSPKLVTTQQEFLLALNHYEALEDSQFDDIRQGALDLVNISRERLKLLDVPEHQILDLERTRKISKALHIHSPVKGTVLSIGARQGQFVTPKTELYMIVDLSQVWVYADVFDYELPWIKIGDEVSMTLASVPGVTFKGTLEYVYPYAESKTRTTKVRIVFDNEELLLRPDMFADVVIKSDAQEGAIVIPSESVIRSGSHAQVFVMKSPGKFEPRKVTLGMESQGEIVILSGLTEGEEIVTSAQFLIDSESSLREATAKMLESMEQEEEPVDHSNEEHIHD